MKEINIRNLTENLLREWLDKQSFLSDFDKKRIFNIGCSYYNDI